MQSLKSLLLPYVKAVKAVHDLRKTGSPTTKICVQSVKTVPVFTMSNWGASIEGCLFANQPRELERAVRAVFYSFDEETQHRLTFTPKEKGEWVQRASFWREHLCCLPQKQYYQAMSCITGWYIHCVKMRKGGAAA